MPAAGADRDHARPFEIFISYAHAAEPIKDRLLVHLAPLIRAGLVGTWTDRAIPPGARWREEIAAAIERADGALFLVSADFLNSAFCMDEGLPAFLRRQRDAGALILFVLADHCDWQAVPAIAEHRMVPLDGRPILAHRPLSLAYTAVTREIRDLLVRHRSERGLRRAPTPLAAKEPTCATLSAALAAIPGKTERLFGRDHDLARIARRFGGGHRGVLLWVGPSGIGKSALTHWWAAHQDWPSGTLFIGYSFNSRGRPQVSSRAFLLRALAALGDTPEPATLDHDLGRRLAERAAGAATLLILDGLECMQQALADQQRPGGLKDQGLLALFETLGQAPGQALCLATSRLPIPDPQVADQPAFRQFTLDALPRTGAIDLLAARGLTGTPAQVGALAERCADQPLTLILTAEVTATFLNGDARVFLDRNWAVPDKNYPDRFISAVMRQLDEGQIADRLALDRAMLRALAVFALPVPVKTIKALSDQDLPMAGLTQALRGATDNEILESVSRLINLGLVAPVDWQSADGLTTGAATDRDISLNVVVREYFARTLEHEWPAGWKSARQPNKAKNIFISYAREDLDAAKEIYDAIVESGGAPWMDEFDLKPGDEWAREIPRAIAASDYFLACLSQRSNSKAGYVQQERKLALDTVERLPPGRVFVIPICLDDCAIPDDLKKWHAMNWSDPDRQEKLARALGIGAPPGPSGAR